MRRIAGGKSFEVWTRPAKTIKLAYVPNHSVEIHSLDADEKYFFSYYKPEFGSY